MSVARVREAVRESASFAQEDLENAGFNDAANIFLHSNIAFAEIVNELPDEAIIDTVRARVTDLTEVELEKFGDSAMSRRSNGDRHQMRQSMRWTRNDLRNAINRHDQEQMPVERPSAPWANIGNAELSAAASISAVMPAYEPQPLTYYEPMGFHATWPWENALRGEF